MTSTKQILERNLSTYNAHDLDAYLANQTPDVQVILPDGTTLRGRDQLGQNTQATWTAFPDGTLAFGEQVFGGDAAAVETVLTGTHTGPLRTPAGTIPPTGRPVRLRFLSILRIRDGRVASEHVYSNQLDILTQLGLAPAPASAG
jgi:ketosteroid isomerase-like protein